MCVPRRKIGLTTFERFLPVYKQARVRCALVYVRANYLPDQICRIFQRTHCADYLPELIPEPKPNNGGEAEGLLPLLNMSSLLFSSLLFPIRFCQRYRSPKPQTKRSTPIQQGALEPKYRNTWRSSRKSHTLHYVPQVVFRSEDRT